jgi:hypothetical protein
LNAVNTRPKVAINPNPYKTPVQSGPSARELLDSIPLTMPDPSDPNSTPVRADRGSSGLSPERKPKLLSQQIVHPHHQRCFPASLKIDLRLTRRNQRGHSDLRIADGAAAREFPAAGLRLLHRNVSPK